MIAIDIIIAQIYIIYYLKPTKNPTLSNVTFSRLGQQGTHLHMNAHTILVHVTVSHIEIYLVGHLQSGHSLLATGHRGRTRRS